MRFPLRFLISAPSSQLESRLSVTDWLQMLGAPSQPTGTPRSAPAGGTPGRDRTLKPHDSGESPYRGVCTQFRIWEVDESVVNRWGIAQRGVANFRQFLW